MSEYGTRQVDQAASRLPKIMTSLLPPQLHPQGFRENVAHPLPVRSQVFTCHIDAPLSKDASGRFVSLDWCRAQRKKGRQLTKRRQVRTCLSSQTLHGDRATCPFEPSPNTPGLVGTVYVFRTLDPGRRLPRSSQTHLAESGPAMPRPAATSGHDPRMRAEIHCRTEGSQR